MNTQDISFWMSLLGELMSRFQAEPSDGHRLHLTHTLREYRSAVLQGLLLPPKVSIEDPWRRAQTMSEWYRLQLDDALMMFRINPSEERMEALEQRMGDYQEAVKMGKIKV
jgi:hypothetical protein